MDMVAPGACFTLAGPFRRHADGPEAAAPAGTHFAIKVLKKMKKIQKTIKIARQI